MVVWLFFFFKQKTAYEMRISDWSSDVFSSDLIDGRFDIVNTHSRRDTLLAGVAARLAGTRLIVRTRHLAIRPGSLLSYTVVPHAVTTVSDHVRRQIGRASGRERVCQYV